MSTPFIASTTQDQDIVLLQCQGRMDRSIAEELLATLETHASEGRTKVILDMAGVTFVDSAGIRLLVNARRMLDTKGGGLRLAGVSEPVRNTFTLINLDRLLDFYPDADAAVASFPA